MTDERRDRWAEALRGRSGAAYWRGLEELLDTPEFRDAVRHEFPAAVDEIPEGITRRTFVKLLGASLALAGVSACTAEPAEKILPYVTQPPEVTPGIPLHYATSMVLDGYATGLLVESHAGRPTKVEGNPAHPASLGAAGVYEQASVLQLYDPDRARVVRADRRRSSWTALTQALAPTALRTHVGARGAGLRLLLEPTSSQVVAELLDRIGTLYPDSKRYYFAPLASGHRESGMRAALGSAFETQYDFSRADVVLALDADFLAAMPFHLRHARDFAQRRHIEQPTDEMNRLYVAEAMLTPTGGLADHRLRVRASEIESLAAAVTNQVMGERAAQLSNIPGSARRAVAHLRDAGGAAQSPWAPWAQAVAHDLAEHAGRSIVIAGPQQSAAVHVVVHLLNAALGNVGQTVWYTESPIVEAGEANHALAPLAEEMRAGQVDTLVILGGNPAYTAPADLDFARLLRALPRSVYLGLYENETAALTHWFIPAAHYLESWGDARAYDGTPSIIQPLIAPMYDGKTGSELLAALAGEDDASAHSLVQGSWRGRVGSANFDAFWTDVLHRGLVPRSAAPRTQASLRWRTLVRALEQAANARRAPAASRGRLELAFRQDPKVYDGRFANVAWLQELPAPVTKLTWDNAAMLSPATAARLAVANEEMVELGAEGRVLRVPVLIVPGHADDAVTVSLGYGRAGAEEIARGVGGNAYRLRTTAAPYLVPGATLTRRNVGHPLAITQMHSALHGRAIVLQATLEAFRRNPRFTQDHKGRVLTLYQPFQYRTGDQWAMTIDLSTCTGCSACVVACQAENNIPVVGKADVLKGREMHWIRIDRYYSGTPDDPAVVMQPMLCQQCEKAPCEYVCPVNATVHSPDGLNEMIYNRCVGTRFCSNNCPYKVRRFNWFDYNAEITETEKMVKNPDVTVRGRGVMEKCTFCVQRIRRHQIQAELEERPLRPGEVKTACQQACPTQAIVFGSYTDPEDGIVRELAQARSYAVLHELGTQPRVNYLARITNPNPAMGGGER
ncbi:MAG TPA: TAT-variant-translocated molybdopterin oxidoreductase [Gemmatimonadaceae bacterium]|nr:TAT-variant-translocated molybdopterin oxidoreductase [Gemmatimonadaceae bacterium]